MDDLAGCRGIIADDVYGAEEGVIAVMVNVDHQIGHALKTFPTEAFGITAIEHEQHVEAAIRPIFCQFRGALQKRELLRLDS